MGALREGHRGGRGGLRVTLEALEVVADGERLRSRAHPLDRVPVRVEQAPEASAREVLHVGGQYGPPPRTKASRHGAPGVREREVEETARAQERADAVER